MVASISRREALAGVGTALIAGSVAGCAGDARPDSPKIVEMTDDPVFDPEIITLEPGRTVRWINNSSLEHTVTSDEFRTEPNLPYFFSGGYESEEAAREAYETEGGGVISPGERFERTFEEAGDFAYYCIPHETLGMTGTVSVSGALMF